MKFTYFVCIYCARGLGLDKSFATKSSSENYDLMDNRTLKTMFVLCIKIKKSTYYEKLVVIQCHTYRVAFISAKSKTILLLSA